MLRPYRGGTSGGSATIYSDAVAIRNFAVERIVDDPRIIDTNPRLTNSERFKDGHALREPWYLSTASRHLGDPRYYFTKNVGDSIATGTDDATIVVQLDPIPARELTIEFDILIRATTFGIDAISTPTELPIDSTVFAAQFLPLMEEHLITSSMWAASPEMTQRIERKALGARGSVLRLPNNKTVPRRRVRTARGF